MNKRIQRNLTAGVLALSLAATLIPAQNTAAAKAKLNRKKITLYIGNTFKLKLRGRSGTPIWRSSNKRVAKVNKKGLVTAKKVGTAKITAKVKGKKYSCNIKVKKILKPAQPPAASQKPAASLKPIASLKPVASQKPAATVRPTKRPIASVKPAASQKPVATVPPTSAVTEQSAYAALNSLRSTYPEGMPLTNSYYYYSPRFGNGYGCYGFAAKLSDTVFGTEKPYRTHTSFDQIKVGDHIRIGNSHSVVVLTKENNFVTVVEGNYNSSVHWDRKITSSSLASSGFKIYTRY